MVKSMPSYDEVLAKNSLSDIHETLKYCARLPCDMEYMPGIPPEALPLALAITEEIKARDADCIIMISGTPGDGVWLKIHQRDGTLHHLDIDRGGVEWWEAKFKRPPTPLFWAA